ncbi:hypothetical protein HZI73_13120 [Vallitalea pronyensis]|uniref:histidine kinase n=1 Tax=Vallitalea pronyensis TaxID=1348613 RepID=A0A8J8SH91_9FIRM|nr:ATP-binding protein [Vallitalea pronyensis]QUI23172.1 hypothetical protein HZI73_13120 [Vallitalea pronyensis]
MRNYIGISIMTVVVITVLSNIGIRYYFIDYIQKQYAKSDKEIISYVNNSIETDGLLDQRELSYLRQQARFKNVEVLLRDTDQEIIFNSSMGMGMNSGKGHHMARNIYRDDYTYATQSIFYEDEVIGYLEIGHSKSVIDSKADNDFIYAINVLYAVSFMIAVIVAVILSILFSKRLTRPIIAIKNSTHHIAKGHYDNVKHVHTDTLEVHALATSIQELARQLNEQEQLRKRLSNDISHELRSPIAVLRSQIEAIMDGVLEPTHERLSKLHDEILRMTKLINDLNELVVVESENLPLHMERVHIKDILNPVLDNFVPLMDSKQITLHRDLDSPLTIMGDKDRLKQIFTNLLTNAYKYTNEGGQVWVQLCQENDKAMIRFKDSGIGIKEEELPYVFQRFYRSDDSRSRKTGGAGIGLSIVKELVKVHEGMITVDSQLKKGSVFTIQFPLIK